MLYCVNGRNQFLNSVSTSASSEAQDVCVGLGGAGEGGGWEIRRFDFSNTVYNLI